MSDVLWDVLSKKKKFEHKMQISWVQNGGVQYLMLASVYILFYDPSWPLFLYFRLSIAQLVDKILLMSGFELQISGGGSNRSTNWATTTALIFIL